MINVLQTDENEPPRKKMKKTITIYSWSLTTPEGQHESQTQFLGKEACERDAQMYVPYHDDDNLQIHSHEMIQPSMNDLLGLIYSYTVHEELRTLVKANCYGCQFGKDSQRPHAENAGCLDTKENQIMFYGQKCHYRIAPARLVKAYEMLATLYDMDGPITFESVCHFLKTIDYEVHLQDTKQYCSEFNVIGGL